MGLEFDWLEGVIASNPYRVWFTGKRDDGLNVVGTLKRSDGVQEELRRAASHLEWHREHSATADLRPEDKPEQVGWRLYEVNYEFVAEAPYNVVMFRQYVELESWKELDGVIKGGVAAIEQVCGLNVVGKSALLSVLKRRRLAVAIGTPERVFG